MLLLRDGPVPAKPCEGLMLLLLLSKGEDIGLLLLVLREGGEPTMHHLGLLSSLNAAVVGRRVDDRGDVKPTRNAETNR
jgi:hypothetical protein